MRKRINMLIRKAKNLINLIGWRLYSRKLHVGHNSRVGIGYEFVSPQNIYIGDNFKAYKNLKLQTWPVYHGEKTGFIPCLTIGNDVSVMDNVQISCLSKIKIGNGVLIGDNVFISDNFHGDTHEVILRHIKPLERELFFKGDIEIGDNVWIGRNVCIFGNVKIGNGAIVGANSVVTHDIAAGSTAAGIPAHLI